MYKLHAAIHKNSNITFTSHIYLIKKIKILFVAKVMLFLANVAYAHPHAWIYIDTSFVVKSDHITAIKQDWRYDKMLTEALLDGLKEESASGKADISYYANETLESLKPYNYFINLTQNNQKISIGEVIHFSADIKDDRLHLRFTAPLAQPIYLHDGKIKLAVYDPTYYIEMLQQPEAPPDLQGDFSANCTLSIDYPEPSEEDYLKAVLLDKGDKAQPEFGALFAETVLLECL